jgi:hypothetical protein
MKRILAAVAPAALPAIRGALVNKVVVLPAHTLDDACQVLVSRVDMIIAGVHFDDSRMFDLLRIAKADPTYRDIPFLCIRGVSGPIALGGNPTGPVLSNFEIIGTASAMEVAIAKAIVWRPRLAMHRFRAASLICHPRIDADPSPVIFMSHPNT